MTPEELQRRARDRLEALRHSVEAHRALENAMRGRIRDNALARNTDPETSHIAAAGVDVTTTERLVFDAICSFGEDGAISDELVELLPELGYRTVTPRYAPLMRKGLIEVIGWRPGRIGKPQRVMRRTV